MKILKLILWFIIHKTGEYDLNKTYYKDLKYYDYKIYSRYEICCLIGFKWLINEFSSHDYYTYHNLFWTELRKPVNETLITI